ncbi:symplekin isoform X2 [Cucurbita moschata]|uniref:Symplekin isoform X2 n=1 Tax=Cucurbita moschata TaxID=3662 RepID=A0A6J1FII2_CUCMO|nr:symplekin isoform X2 [Cucurbita moschata]
MAGVLRERALSLLAAANNHGDLTVKISSLKQVKDIILSIEPSFAAELYSYLVELQSSPESLLRKLLIEVIEDIGLRAMEHSPLLMSVLLASLKDEDSVVAGQSIISGQKLFCGTLREMTLQFHRRGKVERWLEEMWMRMLKFKDDVLAIAIEPGSVGKRLLALKFLETYVLLFTSDTNDPQKAISEGNGDVFNISWLAGGFSILDPVGLMSEASRMLGILLNLLQTSSVPGTYTVTVVSSLAAIARKRPVHYGHILSALLELVPSFEMVRGRHAASIQYSIRSALLGFLRCMHPAFVESRDRLLKALRAMNAGDAADQVIRQVDKMVKAADRASRDAWPSKDDQSSIQHNASVDLTRKRPRLLDDEELSNGREVSKQSRFGPDVHLISPNQKDGSLQNAVSNGTSVPTLDVELSPAEQMIAMIGALLAEGERGAESLEILISNIHPDLLADIVITNMKNLPKASPPLTRHGDLPVTRQGSSHVKVLAPSAPLSNVQTSVATAQVPFSLATSAGSTFAESTVNSLPVDSKRDPRRDPRRLDPRRGGVSSASSVEEESSNISDIDNSISLGKSASVPVTATIENSLVSPIAKTRVEEKIVETPFDLGTDQLTPKSNSPDRAKKVETILEISAPLDPMPSAVGKADDGLVAVNLLDDSVPKRDDTPSSMEYDQYSPSVTNAAASEDTCEELPLLPPYVDLTPEQQITVRNLAAEKIFDSCKNSTGADCNQIRLAIIARLVAQVDADDDIVRMLEKQVAIDYQQQKGHELALHVLYHLRSLDILDSVESSSSAVYEKFLLVVAKSLLDSFPASDKSFSRLLGEVPLLPNSTLDLLRNLCFCDNDDNYGNDTPDIDRVTQGLGTVWNLIVKRPYSRQACLDIALKCAMHSEVKVRATAIRLVANKLYRLSYISDGIEQHATNMFLSAVDDGDRTDVVPSPCVSIEQRAGAEGESQETSVCGSQVSDPGTSENDSMRSSQPTVRGSSTSSLSEAERHISLLFALCVKKPRLLQFVFDAYGRASRSVKEAVHEHIPNLITALGSSDSELLRIISDPPQGSEHLLALVLQVLTRETTPSSDLIATVKHLYETKLKDVTILIPMLPSLSKNEVLPIFPRLVDLPLEKFQRALAHILQGSAHTRPALTPVEVLIAIHNIIPEKDGLALKKITDACSACFEQRTVFTQQVLAKALGHMVEQTPLPLLFMRTVIQAIDAFPTLVDFVMEILSKLVNRQVWRMPKLWFGFLKCAFQTQPHSFRVLLQLPPPQLENALNKYANLKGPLAAYASQPSTKSTLSRPMLVVLGLENERHL